jgi:cytochrome c-type biogenesis protein
VTAPATLGLFVAFAAGLLSFLSPCVLPLVPSYIGFLTGMSLSEMSGRRRVALGHALLFVLGFSLVFVLLGASATALGRALNYYQLWLQRIGGVLIIGFGLVCLGVIRAGFLSGERRVQVEHKPVGYLGSALVGMAFGAGWTPCIGPVLGAVLGFAAGGEDIARSTLLLVAYSLGLGASFLAVGLAMGKLTRTLEWFKRHSRAITFVSAAVLAVFGVILLTDSLPTLTARMSDALRSNGFGWLVDAG